MLHRVRHAMRLLSFEKFEGETDADEAFIGGKMGNMHLNSKRRKSSGRDGNFGKTIVLGLLDPDKGEVRSRVPTGPTKRRVAQYLTDFEALFWHKLHQTRWVQQYREHH